MAELKCLNELYGVGVPCSKVTPLTTEQSIVIARPGYTFTNAEAFASSSNWQTGIANKDLFVIDGVENPEDQKVEDGIYTSDTGDKTRLWSGKRGKRLLFTLTLEQHQIAVTYGGKNWELFKVDKNGNIMGIVNDDGTISGIALSYFEVFEQTEPTATEPPFTPIEYQEEDTKAWSKKGCYVTPTWLTSKIIKPLTLVTCTCSTVATFIFTATVAYSPNSIFDADGTAKSVALSGLTDANFEVIDQGGSVETVTVVESTTTPGTYTITGVDITSGSCQVIATASVLYESTVTTLTAA
jgi:hypothetical protein